MEFTVISFILNALLGLVMFLMKQSHDQTKDSLKDLRSAVDKVKEDYFKKEDFREFKEELWRRLDKMEDKISPHQNV